MAVGIIVPLPAYTLHPAFIARKAEALGFESLWYHEHPILPVDSASAFPATGGEIPWTYRHFSEPAEELFGLRQGQPELLDALMVFVERDHLGDGLFLTLITAQDELKFDTHTGVSPGSSGR